MAADRNTGGRDLFTRPEPNEDVTQPLRFAHSLEHATRGRLFERLAEALELNDSALELLVAELLVYVDATAETLTPAQLWNMRTGLFELVDNVLHVAARERARSRLQLLLLQVAPVDRD